MDDNLKAYINRKYEIGKSDLFSVFMLVGMMHLRDKGKMGMINMQSWMFLSSFEKIRAQFISNYSFDSLLHLGPRTFDELSGEVVQNSAFVISNSLPQSHKNAFYDLTAGKNCAEKENLFLQHQSKFVNGDQSRFLIIPGCPIAYWIKEETIKTFSSETIKSFYAPKKGLVTMNDAKFVRFWQEVDYHSIGFSCRNVIEFDKGSYSYAPYKSGGGFRKWYGNQYYVIFWEDNGKAIKKYITDVSGDHYSRQIINEDRYFNESISWNAIASKNSSFRYYPFGFIFGSAGPSLFASPACSLLSILGFLNSKVSGYYNKIINPTFNVGPSVVAAIPVCFNVQSSDNTMIEKSITIAEEDWNAHESSWDFKKNELLRAQRLCCQNCAELDMLDEDEIRKLNNSVPTNGHKIAQCIWAYKNDWERKFNQLHSNEEELNRHFIEIYGLQRELTPDVPLDEITILQQGEISIKNDQIVWHDDVIVKQFISYAIGCWMGRYRLDQEGLYIAHYPADDEVCTYDYKGQKFEIDDDAIIPLMGTNNPFEDDNALQKLINFIKIVFGEETMTENLNHIEHCLGKSLENYLIKDFWKDHKKMYQNRPIYWLFSSSKGAFQVLTYMHRMNPYTVEKIRTKYLLPYIDYLKGRIEVDEARGVELSSVERQNLAKMKTALDECNEYHDRLHEVAIKAIDFDLDDGVVVNYAKFGDVLARIK